MRAIDVMTTEVISVGPDTSVQALAALLSERGISGVPVVDAEGRVVGIVSEGDVLRRVKIGTARRPEARPGRRRSSWLEGIASDRELARDYGKSHGRTVGDVMTRDVVAVSDTTELADIAILLETKNIKRVPVVRDGKLVGIVSRANLVRALATTKSAPATIADPDDRAILPRPRQCSRRLLSAGPSRLRCTDCSGRRIHASTVIARWSSIYQSTDCNSAGRDRVSYEDKSSVIGLLNVEGPSQRGRVGSGAGRE
jgi:CBS domain-containing protein